MTLHSRRGRLTAAVVIAATVLATAACGGAPAAPAGPADLRMKVWTSNEAHLALLNGIAEAYAASHDGVRSVTFEPVPFDNYTTTLTTEIAGGNQPDMAWILESSAPDFVSSGALVNLTPALRETEGYEYDDLLPSATELWQEDGNLYAYPFSSSPFGVFVNTDLLAAAGQQTPEEMIAAGTWTWENAEAAAAAVVAQTGKGGMVVRDFDYQDWQYLASVWGGFGARPWSEDGTQCQFTSPEMTAAFAFLHDTIFTDAAMPAPGTAADFFAGEATMTVTQISRATLLKDASFEWDLVPLPAGPSGQVFTIGQAGIGVFAKSPQAERATDFLAFLTNPENSAKLAQFFPPPRTSLLTADVLAEPNPLLSPEQLQNVVIDGIAKGEVLPSHTGFAEIQQAVRAALDPMWRPDADVPAVLGGVCRAVQPLLAA